MTRTFLKGEPTPEQERLVESVFAAQQEVLRTVRPGMTGDEVHGLVVRHFEETGFRTEVRDGTPVGFFHGTGHGLGLEVHEAPRVSKGSPELKAGQVVTVEPGLYYPGLGGVRIEDVVWLLPEGAELLSDYPYDWRIP